MFLKRLSAALVIVTCFGWVALGAAPGTLTEATNNGKENSLMAPLAVDFSLTFTEPKCRNGNDGSFSGTITQGDAPFRFRYKTGSNPYSAYINVVGTTFTRTGLTPAVYDVEVIDNNNETFTKQVSISNPPTLSLDLGSPINYPKCSNETTTNLSFSAGGGKAPYTYQLVPSPTGVSQTNGTGNFPAVANGIYNVIVTDANGCQASYPSVIILETPQPISIGHNILSEIQCSNSFGTVRITGLPADPFTIEVLKTSPLPAKTFTAHTNYVYSNLEAGTYSVTVRRTSCLSEMSTTSFTLAPFAPVTLSPSLASPLVLPCGGSETRNVTFTVTGGNPARKVRVQVTNDNFNKEATIDYGASATFENMGIGSYTVRWSDELYPSCSGTQTYIINGPTSPLAWVGEPITAKPLCYNQDGTISMNVSGGGVTKTYYVEGVVATAIVNRPPGSYEVYVRDNNGCETDKKTVTIENQTALTLSYNPADNKSVSCPGGADGEINMLVAGGVGNFRYNLTGTVTRNNISTPGNISINALPGGTYNVVVRDGNNCEAGTISTIEIVAPQVLSIDEINVVQPICFGENGSVSLKVSGGTNPNITYRLYRANALIDTKQNTGVVSFDDLPASAYSIRAFSDLACNDSIIIPFEIERRARFALQNFSDSVMINCNGDLATLTLTASSGEAPYKYSISGGPSDIDFTGNTANITNGLFFATIGGFTNRIMINDRYGCETEVSVRMFEPNAIIISDLQFFNEKCRESDNGVVRLTVSGGQPGYVVRLGSYVRTSSDGIIAFNNVAAGTYDISVTDNKGCTALNPPTGIIIDQPSEDFTITTSAYDPLLCWGDSTTVYIDVNGGWDVSQNVWIKGYYYESPVRPAGSSFVLKGGDYTIYAENADGCRTSTKLNVLGPTRLGLNFVSKTNVSCHGESDASISIRVTGGTPGYKWGIGGSGSAVNDFTGSTYTIQNNMLTQGTHDVIVSDANGCESNVISVPISEPDPITFSLTPVDVTCNGFNDGRISLGNARGGNDSNFRAYLTRPNGIEAQTTYPVIRNLVSGNYSVRITDSKGCSSESVEQFIDQPTPIVLERAFISDSLLCYNDQNATITIEAEGGLPYNLRYRITGRNYQEGNVFSGLQAGDYEVWVRNDQGNCQYKMPGQIKIVNPDDIVVTGIDVTDVRCYNLQNGEAKINAVGGTGTLTYTLTNATVGLPNNPNTTGRFSNLGNLVAAATNYTYKIEDKNVCTKTGSFTVRNPAELVVKYLDHHQVRCNNQNNGWIKIEVTGGNGGYTFKKDFADGATVPVTQVNNTTFTIENYPGGFFQPAVIDLKGCSDTLDNQVEIIDPPMLIIADVIPGEKRCNDSRDDSTLFVLDPVNFGTPGNYRYSIDNGTTFFGSPLFINVRERTIDPVVMDTMGCLATFERQEIIWPDAFNVDIVKNEIRCWNHEFGTLTLSILGGTDPYYVAYNDIMFNNPTEIEKNLTTPTTVDTVGHGIMRYGRNYEVFMKDANDCPVANLQIPNPTVPVGIFSWDKPDTLLFSSITPQRPKCAGNKGFISYDGKAGGTPPYSYWVQDELGTGHVVPTNQDDDGLINVPTGIKLYVFLSDKYGCDAYIPGSNVNYYETYIKAINDTVKVEVEVLKEPFCPLTRDGKVGLQVVDFLKGGVTFTIWRLDTVYNNFYEVFSDVITIEEATDSAEVQVEDPFIIGNFVLEWKYGISQYEINYKFRIGQYKIRFSDNITECYVEELFTLTPDTLDCPDVFPEIFTPNRDGQNDEWIVSTYEKSNVDLKIYNSNGELVYRFSGQVPDNGLRWDGLDYKGRPVPIGTYMYVYQDDVTREKENLTVGTITLLRNN
jgi:gliding motility-associated-like protein